MITLDVKSLWSISWPCQNCNETGYARFYLYRLTLLLVGTFLIFMTWTTGFLYSSESFWSLYIALIEPLVGWAMLLRDARRWEILATTNFVTRVFFFLHACCGSRVCTKSSQSIGYVINRVAMIIVLVKAEYYCITLKLNRWSARTIAIVK